MMKKHHLLTVAAAFLPRKKIQPWSFIDNG